ncbi:MAG: hypothetical protein ACRED1_10370 [Limisphaerales bacterium]
MKPTWTLIVMLSLCGLLSSCGPRPVLGRVFITRGGVTFPLGAVQIEVVSAKDANDFMTQCQAQIDGKIRGLHAAYDTAKAVYDAAARVELQNRTATTEAELGRAREKLNAAAAALRNFPTAKDYFEGFFPAPIETTMTDAEGGFTIGRPKQAAKVFAKVQKRKQASVENYFWLVDLPAAGNKLILSNRNMFHAPRQGPRSSPGRGRGP